MDVNRADERKNQILHPGDRIVTTGGEVYTILPGEVGIGGSGMVYPAQKEGSAIRYVLKESFPAAGYTAPEITWARQNGAVQPAGCGPERAAVLVEQDRADFQREKEISQQVGNSTGHAVRIFDLPAVEEITTGGVCYRAAAGDFDPKVPLFLVMEQQNSRGLFLDEILADCKQEPTAGGRRYPLRTGGLPSAYTAFRIFKEVVQAIGAVHRAGYLHGDIQSCNLFFLDTDLVHGELGHGCLLDFGTARKLEPDGLTAPVGDSMVYTTSGYTAPELWDLQGGALRLSPAADLYSAGRLLHWMLTGKIYTGRAEQDFYLTPYYRHVPKAVQCPPEALALINQLLQRLLHNDPAKRYQSAEELLYGKDAPSVEAVLNLLRPAKNQLGLDLSTLGEDEFVGRADECRQIDNLLKNRRKPVILWGFGGIGKTELAIEYGRRYQQAGRGKVFFVRFAGSFRDTLIGPVADAFSGYSKVDPATRKPKPQEQILQEVLQMLGEYGQDDLLIIDNVDHPGQDFDRLTAESSYKKLMGLPIRLVLTTRTEQEGQVQVGPLAKAELRTIMRRFCSASIASDAELDALIDAVNGHTLAVELMARMLRADRRMKPVALLERLNTVGGLNREKDVRISSQKDRTKEGSGEKERIYEHLRILFDCSGLDDIEQMLLRHGFLIPDMGMDSTLFLDCEPENAAESLDQLISLGWLQESQGENRVLTMHPLVREVVWGELQPDGENCEEFLDALDNQYDPNGVYSAQKLKQAAETFARAAEILPMEQVKQSTVWSTSGYLFGKLGDYSKALEFYQKALAIQENRLPPGHPDLAVSYNNVGGAWSDLGDYHKALAFYQKALAIWEKVLPPDHLDLATAYNNVGCAWNELGNHSRALEFFQKALAIRKEKLSSDHFDIAAIYNHIGTTWYSLGDYRRALEFHETALTIQEKVLPLDHPDLAATYNDIGSAWGALGDRSKQLTFLQKAVFIHEKRMPPDFLQLVLIYNRMAAAWSGLGNYQESLRFAEKALDICQKHLPPKHPYLAETYNSMGYAQNELGHPSLALDYFQKTLAIQQQTLSSNHGELSTTFNNIGYTYGKLGFYEKKMEFYKKALDILRKGTRSDHPQIARTYSNLAVACMELGNYREALKFCHKALSIQKSKLMKDSPDLAKTYSNLGHALQALGENQKALKAYQKARLIREKALPKNHPDLAKIYCNLGLLFGEMGNKQKQLQWLQKSQDIFEQSLPPNHADLATAYNNIGSAWGQLGDYHKGLEFFQKALAVEEKVLPSNHPLVAITYNNIGFIWGKLGDCHKELEFYQKAFTIQEKLLPADSPQLATTCANIACTFYGLGDYATALEWHQKALAIQKKVSSLNDLMGIALLRRIAQAYGKLGDSEKQAEYSRRADKEQAFSSNQK